MNGLTEWAYKLLRKLSVP